MPIDLIDTHVHLLHADLFTYAWCEGNAALAGNHTLDDYRKALAAAPHDVRVQSIFYMEADVLPEERELEAELFSRLAGRDKASPTIIALVAGAQPESPEFPQQLQTLARDVRVRGVRRVLHTQADEVLTSPLLAENLRLLAERELVFDLCVRPRQMPLISALVEQCPQVQFVLDHAGAPDLAGGELDGWRDGIRALASRPNVACKFSGLGSLADPSKPLTEQVRPIFEHCLECFYPERMLWGSDWPVSADLASWLRTTAELFAGLQDYEQTAIGVSNANRIYRLN
jgi:predicted TIM-barrel fold metal-dependent hydrolase|uniref:amidohydrolase family protein n=1 Tax=Cephaloticoccus sp. TaxID=1985742 RepID=UPI004049689A